MRTCSIAFALAVAAFTFAPPAFAQEGGDAPEAKPGEADKDQERAERRQRRGGGFMRRMGIQVDELKEPLGLSDEQASQLEAMNQDMQKQMQEFMERMRSGEMPDRSKIRETMQKGREDMQAKLKAILTPEQFTKYTELRQKRMAEGRRRWGGMNGRAREDLTKRLRKQAIDVLALDEEAAALVLPLLDTVLETQKLLVEETKRRRDEFRKKVRESSDPDELTSLLKEFRSAAEEDKKQVAAAQDKLRELLTLQQEAQLVGLQILD